MSPPNSSLASKCDPPPRTGGRGAHSPGDEGLGESQFRRFEKKLGTHPTLWFHFTAGVCQANVLTDYIVHIFSIICEQCPLKKK
jgi:hypothetical protein